MILTKLQFQNLLIGSRFLNLSTGFYELRPATFILYLSWSILPRAFTAARPPPGEIKAWLFKGEAN